MMTPLYKVVHFTFRFADDRIIPRFHLEGINLGGKFPSSKIGPWHRREAGPARDGDRGPEMAG